MVQKYILSAILLLCLDALFLWTNNVMFHNQVITVQRVVMQPDYIGAVLAYICIILLLWYFIIRANRSVNEAFLLGFLTYGIFEFTNKTIFKKWEYMTVAIDTLWGGILFGLTTYLTRIIRL